MKYAVSCILERYDDDEDTENIMRHTLDMTDAETLEEARGRVVAERLANNPSFSVSSVICEPVEQTDES